MRTLKIIFALLSVFIAAPPVSAAGPDWGKYEGQAVSLLRDYLRIDNTNPPGNEAKAAEKTAGEML